MRTLPTPTGNIREPSVVAREDFKPSYEEELHRFDRRSHPILTILFWITLCATTTLTWIVATT